MTLDLVCRARPAGWHSHGFPACLPPKLLHSNCHMSCGGQEHYGQWLEELQWVLEHTLGLRCYTWCRLSFRIQCSRRKRTMATCNWAHLSKPTLRWALCISTCRECVHFVTFQLCLYMWLVVTLAAMLQVRLHHWWCAQGGSKQWWYTIGRIMSDWLMYHIIKSQVVYSECIPCVIVLSKASLGEYWCKARD